MGERLIFFIGSAIIATTLALLTTYPEYKLIAEMVTVLIATTGSVISIVDFIRKKR